MDVIATKTGCQIELINLALKLMDQFDEACKAAASKWF